MLAGFQSQPSETRTAEAKERLTSKPQGVELVGDTPGLKYDESSPRCYKVLQMESRVCKHGKMRRRFVFTYLKARLRWF